MSADSAAWKDLMGDDLQMRIIRDGEEPSGEEGDIGDSLNIEFSGFRLDDFHGDVENVFKVVTPFINKKECMITLGEGDVVPGLEMAARFMRLNSHALVKCRSKYAYGAGGRRASDSSSKLGTKTTDLVPESDVVFHVHLKAIVPADSHRFKSNEFRLERSSSKKQLGNDCYRYEWDEHGIAQARALRLYGKARDDMADLFANMQEMNDFMDRAILMDKALAIIVDCLNNSSAVHLKARNYGQAKESAAQVLKYDPDNIKALCRAARAAMFDPAGTYEECEYAISAAEEIDCSNGDVKRVRLELERKRKQNEKREKKMYSRMMQGLGGVGNGTGPSSIIEEENDVERRENSDALGQLGVREHPPLHMYLFASVCLTAVTFAIFQLFFPTQGREEL